MMREEGANPPRGFVPDWLVQSGSFNLCRRGELVPGDRDDRAADTARRSGASDPTAKSSTTKGPTSHSDRMGREGLAGKFERRRCRTAQAKRRWVSESFSFLLAEIDGARPGVLRGNYAAREGGHTTQGREPSSQRRDRSDDAHH